MAVALLVFSYLGVENGFSKRSVGERCLEMRGCQQVFIWLGIFVQSCYLGKHVQMNFQYLICVRKTLAICEQK